MAFLSDGFWVLKRFVDVDAADFLVQEPAGSIDELRNRQRRIEVYGVVQAKYFEGHNEVRVDTDHVECSSGVPRDEFFASIHTDDPAGHHVDYFFSASELRKEFRSRLDSRGRRVYVFSLANDRDYAQYKNLPPRKKCELVLAGMRRASAERNQEFINRVLSNTWAPLGPSPLQRISPDEYVQTYQDCTITVKKWGRTWHTTKEDFLGTRVTLAWCPGDPGEFQYNPATDTWSAKPPGQGTMPSSRRF